MLPQVIQPMLATMAEPFDSDDFTYEIKWDGYRCLAFLDGATRLQSRNLKDISPIFPELLHLHQRTSVSGCILDGEIIAIRDGKPNFSALQKRGQLRKPDHIKAASVRIPVVFTVFDLLYFNHQPLVNQPIEVRRTILAENFTDQDELILTKYITGDGLKYFQSACQLELEGVIAKKKASLYLPGKRSKAWLKFKRKLIKPFIICGYVINPTTRGSLRSLILGSYTNDRLTPFGMVGTGFTMQELKIIEAELATIQTNICPFTGTAVSQKNVIWTKPILVCDVEYLELTDDGNLRHPSFKGFRPDLRPEDCIFEE